jgi:hypothetical protein
MNILKDNGKYTFYNQLIIEKKLAPKNYLFDYDKQFGNCFLTDADDFTLPNKIYDIDRNLKDMIKKSFNNYPNNLGVLLTGNKGQGKSLLAKELCKELKLPIIIINAPIDSSVSFVPFLNDIKQDYILFIDEFEKLFSVNSNDSKGDKKDYHSQESFLSFMDGAINNKESKILFLLTTNENVNEFLINRPSRIKFLKEYNELSEELFNMLVDDKLKNKKFKQDLIDHVSLINLNIDLLLCIVDDINLFNKPFSSFMHYYNYKLENYAYEMFEIEKNGNEKFIKYLSSRKKINIKDNYVNDDNVARWISFEENKIIYEMTDWKKVRDKNVEFTRTIKLVPVSIATYKSKLAF